MQTNTINGITKQYKLDKLLIDTDVKNWRGSPRKTFSVDELMTIAKEYKKKKTQNQIAEKLGTNRSTFKSIRLNKNHPNHIALIDIFGEVRPRQRHKPLKKDLEQQAINKSSALNLEKTDQLTDEMLRSIAIERTREIIMSSDNSEFDARYKELALLYKRLKESLRLDKINDPLYEHSKALYDEVTKELINVTRKIYDDRQESQSLQKPQDQKNT